MSEQPAFLEAATGTDVPALVALERRCQSHPWTAEHFLVEMKTEHARVLVLRAAPDRGLVAYCVIRVVADELHVLNLAVAPESRRRGFARRLLETALRLGERRGAPTALLEVRSGNREALALYASLGFAPLQVRKDYYREPPEDAVVLRRKRP